MSDHSLQTVDELIEARWIIPVEPAGQLLENHSIILHQGKILDILDTDQAYGKYQPDNRTFLPSHVLIPGLINAHTHASMTLLRGYADDYHLMDWLQNHIWPAEQKWVSEEFVADGTLLAMAEMIRGGTTFMNEMYFYPEVAARVARDHGMRAMVGLIVLDFPSQWASNADEYLEKGLALHDELHDSPLIRTAFAPHAPYTVSDAPLQRIAVLSNELGIPVHTHVHETQHEVDEAVSNNGKRPLQRLHELGLVNQNLLAVHMTALTDDEISLLADNNVNVVHCPESNLKLASGLCPVQKLLDAGVNVALGTDGAASNNDLSMLGEMQTAALIGKITANDAEAVKAQTVLEMATINGARALGIDDITGSLVPGKAADMVAINLDYLDTLPVYHPHSHIAYTCTDHHVSHVWINGALVINKGEYCTLDIHELRQKAIEWQNRLSPSA